MIWEGTFKKNRRNGYPLLISVCLHIFTFIFLGLYVLNNPQEPRESISVELVKTTHQVRRTHRDITMSRRFSLNNSKLTRRLEYEYVTQSLYNSADITPQVSSAGIPGVQYEPLEIKAMRVQPEIANLKKPLAAPKIVTQKLITQNTPRENLYHLHDRLLKLSSIYSPASFDLDKTDSNIIQSFLQIVSKRIEKSKRYPGWAMEAGLQGRVVIRFTILRDGTLGEKLELVKSSGAEILDNAAIAAIKSAAPFPELPPSLDRDWIQIELPMDFRLKQS